MAELTVLAIMWAVTLWRVRPALKQPAKRPMWCAFAALAASLTVELPQVGAHLDTALDIANISTLIKQLAGMIAAASVLEWVVGSTQPIRRLGAALAWRHAMTGAAMVTLGILFAFTPRIEASDFIDSAPGHPVTTAYEMVWLAYLGLAMLCATAMFAVAWQRSADNGRLIRLSFAVLATGTGLGVAYAICRIAILSASLADKTSQAQAEAGFNASDLLQDAAIILILAGTCIPALTTVISIKQDRRDLIALRPLWQLVTQSRPDTVLDDGPPSSGRELALADLRLVRLRLIRRTVEIRDALATLYEYCDLDPAPYAEDFATSIGLAGVEHQALVEAVTIRYALMRVHDGTADHSIVKADRGGSDLRSEVLWLRAVSRALNNHLRIQTALNPLLAARNEQMESA